MMHQASAFPPNSFNAPVPQLQCVLQSDTLTNSKNPRETYYQNQILKNLKATDEFLQKNKRILEDMRNRGNFNFQYFRKRKYQDEVKTKLEKLNADVSQGLVFDPNLERTLIYEQAQNRNPTPELLWTVGHVTNLSYKGKGDEFELGKYFYRKKDGNVPLVKPKCDYFKQNFELKAIPALILALEELYSIALDRLEQEGKPRDLLLDSPSASSSTPVQETPLSFNYNG